MKALESNQPNNVLAQIEGEYVAKYVEVFVAAFMDKKKTQIEK
jgi:hypothetical protein